MQKTNLSSECYPHPLEVASNCTVVSLIYLLLRNFHSKSPYWRAFQPICLSAEDTPTQIGVWYMVSWFFLIIYLAVPGLRCCMSAFSSCGKWELLSCWAAPALGTQAQWLWHVGLGAPRLWGLPRPGIKPASPALVGKFSCTGPSEKSSFFLSLFLTFLYQKAKISSAEYKRMT